MQQIEEQYQKMMPYGLVDEEYVEAWKADYEQGRFTTEEVNDHLMRLEQICREEGI
tara:strand:- start:2332 stop:2499 length:168 start_codon:yes stop_codon:yes gene_type:complete